jgi:hypothetical protein
MLVCGDRQGTAPWMGSEEEQLVLDGLEVGALGSDGSTVMLQHLYQGLVLLQVLVQSLVGALSVCIVVGPGIVV